MMKLATLGMPAAAGTLVRSPAASTNAQDTAVLYEGTDIHEQAPELDLEPLTKFFKFGRYRYTWRG